MQKVGSRGVNTERTSEEVFEMDHISHCPMMGDGSLPKRCPAKYQRLVMIIGDYHVEYYEDTNCKVVLFNDMIRIKKQQSNKKGTQHKYLLQLITINL